jgi:hypothetical protein
MNDAALLVAALEGHGIRLYVRGALIDVRSDDRAVEREPLALLDELTRRRVEVIAYLQARETPPAPVCVVDKRAEIGTETPSSPVCVNLYSAVSCPFFPEPHAHDRIGGECLDENLHQRVQAPGWKRPAGFEHLPLFPSIAMSSDRETSTDIAFRLAGRHSR